MPTDKIRRTTAMRSLAQLPWFLDTGRRCMRFSTIPAKVHSLIGSKKKGRINAEVRRLAAKSRMPHRLAAARIRNLAASSPHDHRHRRAGGVRQGHARQAACRALRLRHLDTGLIYRAVAKAMLDAGQPARRSRAGGDRRGARARSRAVRRGRARRPMRSAKPPPSYRRSRRCARRCSRFSAIRPHPARGRARRPRHRHRHLSRTPR